MSSEPEKQIKSRFAPGVSGNPKGRPKKGLALTDLLNKHLSKREDGDALTRKQRLVEALYAGSVPREIRDAEGKVIDVKPGDPVLLKYIFDRIDGKPDITQRIVDDTLPQVVIVAPEGAAE